ncbi:MAG: glycosyltransferase [Limibacillus sp.]
MSAAPLTIVIPTLNAATQLPGCLAALTPGRQRDLIGEVLVVDGGSDDGTREAATAAGCRFLEAPRGRGSQLRAGAGEAAGAFLLFLHADTRLGDGWAKEAEAFMDATGPATGLRRAGRERPAHRRTGQLARAQPWAALRRSGIADPQGLL